MKLVNITLPEELKGRIAKVVRGRYTSPAEFVRISAVRLLAQHRLLSPVTKVDVLRQMMRSCMLQRGESFSPGKEIQELRKVRDRVYHARRS